MSSPLWLITRIKTLLYVLLLVILSQPSFAQEHWMARFSHLGNFYSIKAASEQYFSEDTSRITNKACGYKDFNRWLYFMEPRVDENGSMASYTNAIESELAKIADADNGARIPAVWEVVGPNKNLEPVNKSALLGLITSIWVDTSNFQTVYAGSNSSGLFVTYDGGNNWQSLTDKYMVPGVDVIIKHPLQPQTIYIGTGFFTWGKDYGVGVLKSSNNGQTWAKTGLNTETFRNDPNLAIRNIGYRIGGMVQYKNNPNIILALVIFEYDKESKIMRTDNGGVSWQEVYKVTSPGNKQLFKIESHPLNPDFVLVSGSHILKSNNFGLEWEQIDNCLIDTTTHRFLRASTAMHPDDTTKILVLTATSGLSDTIAGYNRLFLSTDAGRSFDHVKWYSSADTAGYEDTSALNTLGYYKMELEWSKAYPNRFFTGGFGFNQHTFIEPLRIKNDSLSTITNYHVDIRELKTYKQRLKDGSVVGWVFHGNDGGITKGMDVDVVHWNDISRNGLNITQYYGIGIPGNGSGLVIGGTQDGNYEYLHNLFHKKLKNIGDAGEVVFDHNNPNNVYMVTFMTNYYGRRSVDGGQTFPNDGVVYNFTITDPKRRNDAPLEISKNNPKRLYIGGLDVWRTVDGFVTNPVKISNLVKNDQTHIAIKTIREAKSNSNVLYVARNNPHWNCDENTPNCDRRRLFKTMNGLSDTTEWIDITPSTTCVPLGEAAISDLAVNPYNAHEFYISMTRGIPGKQVYKGSGTSTISWESISSGLPALPVNCLLYRYGSTLNELFAGTDAGVYYRNDSLDSWVPFGNGMPLTVISDLEIDYATNELYASTFGRGIYKASLCFDPGQIDPIIISNNEIWDNRVVTNDVIITTGAQLTILGTAELGPGRSIVVQKGGKLIVNGGKVTNACSGNPWKGITVQGTASETQNHTDQGFVHLFNGAIIENAYIGIHCVNSAIPIDGGGTVEDPNYLPTGGGIILAYDSKFINNQVAVQFEKYDKYSMSRFERCSFEQDNEVMTSAFLKYFIRLNQVKSINILGCTFVSDFVYGTATNSKPTYGIYSNNSSFMVDRKCMDTDCNNFLNSSFEGLKYGIYALSKIGGMTFSVKHTSFTRNRRGIYASSANNFNISNNLFSINKMGPLAFSDTISGIYLDNCSGYIVEENELTNLETTAPPSFITYGVYINNSGESNNMVYKNYIFNCNYGITAQDKNRNTNGSTGLLIKCNQFTSVKIDINVVKTPSSAISMGIATSQGSNGANCESPAGNLFTNPTTTTGYYSIYNDCEFINYYHHNPASHSKVRPSRVTENTVTRYPTLWSYSINCCPPNSSGGGGSSIIDGETALYKIEAEATTETLSTLIDEGETTDKVLEVNLASPSEALEVRNSILQYSPFVSDTVLKSSINREELLNNAMLRDIMVANPHSAKSETLLQELDMRIEPMPEYMKDEILEGVFVLSAKELMEAKRDLDLQFYNYGFNRLLSASLTDTTPVPVDTIMALLAADGSARSRLQQAWVLLEAGDTTNAANRMASLPNEISLSGIDVTEHEEQMAFMQWLIQNPVIEEEATDALTDFIQSPSNAVSSAARSIMVAHNLLEYEESYLVPDLTKSAEVKKHKAQAFSKSNEFIRIYPNPGKDFITLEYSLLDTFNSYSYEVFDQAGKIVKNGSLGKSVDQTIIDTRDLTSGNYYITLISGSKNVASARFVISK